MRDRLLMAKLLPIHEENRGFSSWYFICPAVELHTVERSSELLEATTRETAFRRSARHLVRCAGE